MSRPTIGVYTPVLNEAKHVERWAESARCADYLLMLDTGSHDSTPELARSCGIDVHRVLIDPFRFDDARNMAMSLIPSHVDIVIQLDADEVFSEPNWRRHIDANPDHDRWSYWLEADGHAAWGRTQRSNCVRRSGFRWEHPIHEVIAGPEATCHLDELVIVHKPDGGKSRSYVLGMLEAAVKQDPDDARSLFYLGREYKYRAMWDKGRDALWKYVQHPNATWPPERSEAYILIAEMAHDPLTWLWKAVAETPHRREPFYFIAVQHLRRGEYDLAWSAIVQAEARGEFVYTTHAEAWGDQFDKQYETIKRKAGQ